MLQNTTVKKEAAIDLTMYLCIYLTQLQQCSFEVQCTYIYNYIAPKPLVHENPQSIVDNL